ncbi:DUF4321 domain-containing protein [candidate division KSB1 bacterium]|nr:DUF4321 domain-containing protein [candidate division KSB1 bacterium]
MMRKRSIFIVFLILILGAVLGSVMGEVIGLVLPEGVVKQVFIKGLKFEIGPITVDLVMFTFTIGFSLKLNFISVLGIGISAYLLKWYR